MNYTKWKSGNWWRRTQRSRLEQYWSIGLE
jgi:hypothetical protein